MFLSKNGGSTGGSPGICFWKETDIQVHETLPILDTLQKTCFFVDIAVEIAKLKD